MNQKLIVLLQITIIFHEVLRFYPPAIAQYRHAYNESKIGNIIVPEGVDITLPTLLIQHDPQLWGDDANEFKPERFSEGITKASKDELAFFPFGWGPRTYIGQNFSIIEAKVSLTMILQHFSFELSPSYNHAPYTVMILQPQHGAQPKFAPNLSLKAKASDYFVVSPNKCYSVSQLCRQKTMMCS